jgi:hypothetical protein
VPSRKAAITTGFLTLTTAAVTAEIWFALDNDPDTVPWTALIADHVPAPVTFAVIALLLAWLPGHFIEAYASRKKLTMIPIVTVPATPEVDAPREPLVNVGWITAAAAALLAALVAFGLNLTQAQTGAVLTVVTVAAPLIVAVVGRRRVFSPATVRTMVVDAAVTGQTRTEAAEVPVPAAVPPLPPGLG